MNLLGQSRKAPRLASHRLHHTSSSCMAPKQVIVSDSRDRTPPRVASSAPPARPPPAQLKRRNSFFQRATDGAAADDSAPRKWSWMPRRSKATAESNPLSPDVIAAIMSSELADAVNAAAQAAADTAHAVGNNEELCAAIYAAACRAAAAALDVKASLGSGANAGGDAIGAAGNCPPSLTRRYSSAGSRIEGTLARAIKKSAIRVTDLFQEWDEDRNVRARESLPRLQRERTRSQPSSTRHAKEMQKCDAKVQGAHHALLRHPLCACVRAPSQGVITKKELRSALTGTGIAASNDEVDQLFAKVGSVPHLTPQASSACSPHPSPHTFTRPPRPSPRPSHTCSGTRTTRGRSTMLR